MLAGGAFAGWQFLLKPEPPNLCQEALESAAASMHANQFAQAKTQALGVVARCTGEFQDRAKTVLKAAQIAEAADDNCDKAMRLADSQLAEGRLKLALRTLDAQPGTCLNRDVAIARKQRIESSRVAAAEKLSLAQTQLADGLLDQARASVDEAERLDRDNPELSKTRRDIAGRASDMAKADAPPASLPVIPAIEPTQPRAQSLATMNQVECSVLVRAGRRALSNNSYDEAMQNSQEALKAFANCPGAQELFQNARQAKDKARQSAVIQ